MKQAILLSILLLTQTLLVAKNVSIGIYALVDQVTFEPDGGAPDRVRICGVFVVPKRMSSGECQDPQAGCLNFEAAKGFESSSRNDWAELKAEAGTGHVVGFANYWVPIPGVRNGFRSLEVTLYEPTENPSFEPYLHPHLNGVISASDKHDRDPDFDKIAVQLEKARHSLK